jgi:hypothetical protein
LSEFVFIYFSVSLGFGQPSAGRFFWSDFFTACFQSPLIISSSGSGLGLLTRLLISLRFCFVLDKWCLQHCCGVFITRVF